MTEAEREILEMTLAAKVRAEADGYVGTAAALGKLIANFKLGHSNALSYHYAEKEISLQDLQHQ